MQWAASFAAHVHCKWRVSLDESLLLIYVMMMVLITSKSSLVPLVESLFV